MIKRLLEYLGLTSEVDESVDLTMVVSIGEEFEIGDLVVFNDGSQRDRLVWRVTGFTSVHGDPGDSLILVTHGSDKKFAFAHHSTVEKLTKNVLPLGNGTQCAQQQKT